MSTEYTNPRVRDRYAGKSVRFNTDYLPLMNDTIYLKEYLPVFFPTGRYNKYLPIIAEG